MRFFVPAEVTRRHAISRTRQRAATVLASTVAGDATGQAVHGRVVDTIRCRWRPMANGLILRGNGYRTSIGLIGNTLVLDGRRACPS